MRGLRNLLIFTGSLTLGFIAATGVIHAFHITGPAGYIPTVAVGIACAVLAIRLIEKD